MDAKEIKRLLGVVTRLGFENQLEIWEIGSFKTALTELLRYKEHEEAMGVGYKQFIKQSNCPFDHVLRGINGMDQCPDCGKALGGK